MPLKIAYVIHMFPKVSETFIAHELAELRRRGVQVRVLSLLPPRENFRHAFIADSGLEGLVNYDLATFEEQLRQFRPDWIHAHFATEPTALARQLSARLGVPYSFTAHGYDIRRKPPEDLPARAAAAEFVVTVSEANARHLVEQHGVLRSRIRVIPCGVDTARFEPLTAAASKSSDIPKIVCVARHVAVKNLNLLLQAFAELKRRGAVFQGVLVGDGPLRLELEAACDRLELRDRITFTGALPQEEVLPWWQQADIAVLSSENEGMPVCLMEAAACGVPAVATAVGGIPELIVDGETGLLVPPAQPDALAGALCSLLANPERRKAMGRAARQRATAMFSLERQIDHLLALWKEVVPCPLS